MVSASASSYPSPTLPTDGSTPTSARRSEHRMDTYCAPCATGVRAHRPPFVQSPPQRVQHEAGVGRSAHPPADDAPRVGVDDEGHVDEARPGRDTGEVRRPEHVWGRDAEPAFDMVERARRLLVAHLGARRLATDDADQPSTLHQPGRRAAGNNDTLLSRPAAHLAHAVDSETLIEHTPDSPAQPGIPLGPWRRPAGIGSRAACSCWVDGATGSTPQIASTPYASRWASMTAIIARMAGRAPPG